ncbi:MAG: ROK family protein [Anaerolineales bacterium]
MDAYYGGIEAGGTKFVCAIGRDPQNILAQARFPTTPDETLTRVAAFFTEFMRQGVPLRGLGVAAFGPLDLNPASPTFGSILATPKEGWSGVPIAPRLEEQTGLKVTLDTDVNGAALGESLWGAAEGTRTSLYLTIGTGIGGGLIVDGKPLHGLLHPEMGHLRLSHDRVRDPFEGICPFHGDCFEGLASGPALERRMGQPAAQISPEHPIWELEAEYIAQALHTLICVVSPQKIILGGGVMNQRHLFPRIWRKVQASLNGYLPLRELQAVDRYIVPPALGALSGVLGAIALARSREEPSR